MANIISGKNGTLQASAAEVANMAEWSLEAKAATNSHATNSTAGWKTRSSGVKDATGKVKIMLTDGTAPTLVLGQSYPVEFHLDETGSNFYSGSIMIESLGGLVIDTNDGKEVAVEYAWGANGPLLANGNAPMLDTV